MVLLRWLVVVATMTCAPLAHAGQATCSNPGVPVGAAATGDLMPGRLTLNLTAGLLPIHSKQVLDEAQGQVLYDTRLVLVETRVAGEYALRPWIAVGFAMPYRVVDVSVTNRDPSTGMELPTASTIHERTETLRGIGDPSLGVHLARELGAIRLHARFGTSLPLGRTEEDPFLLGTIGQEHEHIQFGSGTLIPFAVVEAQRAISRITISGWALAHVSLYENGKGFRAGHRFSGGFTGTSGFGLRDWTFSLAAEAHGETAERWQGTIHPGEGNAGRFDLFTGATAAWRPMRSLAVVADLKLPVYSHVVGPQLDYGVVAGLGLIATFDLKKRATWRGLDHAAVGSDLALVPVAGRITVFDLWAVWCAPCRELDSRLEALVRAHPERLAVRTLDVGDSDSAAWKRYLAPGTFDLPHVKVYDIDGTLLFERSAPPAELARAIEELLRR
ncbi:MAG: hypothetical protein H6Q90_2712 [Deltaproteobacteria bacterium]|nr:hypothetical protein [Deltaproteobacteria bacterium]